MLKLGQFKISHICHTSCQDSIKCGSDILRHGACPGLHHTVFLPLDLCHWSLSPPNPSLMSLVLMLASKHQAQRHHLDPFNLNYKFILVCRFIGSQSLPPPPSFLIQNYLEDQEFWMLSCVTL